MRFFLFLFGIALGIAGTLAYTMFVLHPAPSPMPQVLPPDPPITVTLGESFLTAIVRRGALDTPGVTIPGNGLRAEPIDGAIVVHATVDVLGQTTTGTVTLRPVLDAGRMHIVVVSTDLGSVPLPAIDQVLEAQIDARVASLLAGLPVTVTGVRVERGRGLVVTCEVDLRRLEQRAKPR